MPAATPTLETVIAAVKTAIDAVNPAFGTVLDSDLKTESEREGIEAYQQPAGGNDGAIDLWIVTSPAPTEVEGEAPGENYSIYPIRCHYYNVRVGDANWEKTARTQVETIRDALNQASSIFRIGGQVPLKETAETATVISQGFEEVQDSEGAGMLAYKAVIGLRVEARRFA